MVVESILSVDTAEEEEEEEELTEARENVRMDREFRVGFVEKGRLELGICEKGNWEGGGRLGLLGTEVHGRKRRRVAEEEEQQAMMGLSIFE